MSTANNSQSRDICLPEVVYQTLSVIETHYYQLVPYFQSILGCLALCQETVHKVFNKTARIYCLVWFLALKQKGLISICRVAPGVPQRTFHNTCTQVFAAVIHVMKLVTHSQKRPRRPSSNRVADFRTRHGSVLRPER